MDLVIIKKLRIGGGVVEVTKVVIRVTSSTAVRVASGTAVEVASSGLWKGINTSKTIASLFRVRLSQFYKVIIIISFTSIRAKLISLSVYS